MKAKILMGLPLAGKSSWLNVEDNVRDYKIVSADAYKESHKDYNPNKAFLLHEWSVKKAEKVMNLLSDEKIQLIMDGGGINNSYTTRIIKMLQEKGYYVELIHIKTPIEVCLKRNSIRERKVPVEAIIEKSAKENAQFQILSNLVNKISVIEFFTHEHIFIDMDGVLAALTTLPKINGKIDFVNSQLFKYLPPVQMVIDKLNALDPAKHKLYILSAIPNSFSYIEKMKWLDKHYNIPKDRRHFVNSGRHKAEMLENLRQFYKLKKHQVTLIDDTHMLH